MNSTRLEDASARCHSTPRDETRRAIEALVASTRHATRPAISTLIEASEYVRAASVGDARLRTSYASR